MKVVLIVEGLKDEDQIKKAFNNNPDVICLVTEGTKMNNRIKAEIEDYLRQDIDVYILSDPDIAGEHLCNMIQFWYPEIPRLEVNPKECAYFTGKKFKCGIEYASYDYLRHLIAPYIDAIFVLDEKRDLHGGCIPIKYKVDKDGCWICVNHQLDKDGYPRFVRDKKKVTMSRYVFELYKEQIDKGNIILHSCDNPSCINPKHLSQGTHKENSEDRNRKKRQAYGIKNGNVKLTEDKVLEIKKLLNDGKTKQKEIASKFGVSVPLIQKIKYGKLWSHL